ncbi:MAG: hypothetical protein IT292_02825 [Deltaproteobacteria bacterium]|nr:hypothetical protein [Deltaproteobacteria bacterium]
MSSNNDELFDAEQLLRMIEQLCHTYSKESNGGAKFPVPWHGILLIVEQVRRKISKIRDRAEVVRTVQVEEDYLAGMDNDEFISEIQGQSSIARRIKPSPVKMRQVIRPSGEHRVRDLMAELHNVDQQRDSQIDLD